VNIDPAIDIVLLALMSVIALAVVRMRDLFGIAMLFSMFSLLSAGVFTILDAADVAFTEAAVGAGISTILMLATLTRTARTERGNGSKSPVLPLLVVFVTGALLVFGTSDLPRLGDPDAPIHHHVAPRYILESPKEIGIPNIVTSVLASYRGYDTLGETTVIFTAGVAVIALLGLRRTRRRRRETTEDAD
jgi:multicomponent Na+:H+ antiporter subunit B